MLNTASQLNLAVNYRQLFGLVLRPRPFLGPKNQNPQIAKLGPNPRFFNTNR